MKDTGAGMEAALYKQHHRADTRPATSQAVEMTTHLHAIRCKPLDLRQALGGGNLRTIFHQKNMAKQGIYRIYYCTFNGVERHMDFESLWDAKAFQKQCEHDDGIKYCHLTIE